jgi:hypothetical protein
MADDVRRSGRLVRRVGTFGLGALVMGAVLLGTGVAVSAQTTAKAGSAAPLKKNPTTTTTTTPPTTTTPTTPPSTNPNCVAAPATGTGTNTTVTPNTTATLTATPGTCLVNGSVVSITGSGFQPGLGVLLECNSDPNQPTATSNNIPVSCTSVSYGPSVLTISGGSIGPVNFPVKEGTVGPPCAPDCTGVPTDSSGGSPFVDAAQYPCPPTPAQQTAGDTCGILFGDTGNDAVTVNLSFNVAVPPPPAVVSAPGTTVAPASSAGEETTPAAKAKTTSTGSGALAFTGTGPGLWWLALVGMILIVLGFLSLVLVDQPRRLVRLVAHRVGRSRPDSP